MIETMDGLVKESNAEEWDLVIRPDSHIFDLKLKEVWRYRDLLWLLVRRDFVSFYKQTILGPIWFFIQPIFVTLTYTLIFGRLAGLSTDNIPGPLFYLAGITCWNYYSECLVKTASVFRDNSNVFGKVYFPRLIMPLSIILSNLVRFAVQLLLFFLVMGFYAFKYNYFHITGYIMLFPLIVLLMALFGLGTGMLISAMTTKYRDLYFLLAFGVQLAMYSTTVVYPLSTAPNKYKWLIALNPLTSLIETLRLGFLGKGTFSWELLGINSLTIIFFTLLGIVTFNKVERNFIDTV
jgi:lipopolysaccharide transport system permease protein